MTTSPYPQARCAIWPGSSSRAASPFAMLSHNRISSEGVARVSASDFEFILSTDTVGNPNIVGQPKFKTVSVAPLFAETIIRYYNYDSISPLFTTVPESLMPYTIAK